MTQKNQIYKCEICGNIVEILHEGAGELVCCGQPMKLIKEKAKDEGTEKHLPVVELLPDNGVRVKVGEVPHPMIPEHYIEWIEIKTADDKMGKKFLKPGDKTEVEFNAKSKVIEVRAYCNVHGLWKTQVN